MLNYTGEKLDFLTLNSKNSTNNGVTLYKYYIYIYSNNKTLFVLHGVDKWFKKATLSAEMQRDIKILNEGLKNER